MKRSRRHHSAAFKAEVALASLRLDYPIRSCADRYGVHPNLVRAWQAQLLHEAVRVFEESQRGPQRRALALQQMSHFAGWDEARPAPAGAVREPLHLDQPA